ncbi:NAD(P)-binding protein [Streptosporangium sp. NBC_01756]|uniref:NAD(P)-binding protein n=1 Tax=Streptosporangium sp. NBC_01756 TaxID=2975950 RepID=UPI002DDC055F|nr:NAD(P)-binding protein [Streptosporangium sp. NBC_01756]WSC82865.1 NAD(P)-binding protein [Streptosporangium sp. NBC_01756]
MSDPQDVTPGRARELGMDRPITRRDFFDGVATVAGVAALGSLTGCAAGLPNAIGTERLKVPREAGYPPDLTGLRGNTAQALSVPHALRDDRFWDYAGVPEPTGEHYDLVVVGAGISGVCAAHRWLERAPDARILVLDNHDEVGGHARRNEFHPKDRRGLLIGYGGSQSIEAPSVWTPEGKDLLGKIGVKVKKFEKYFDQRLYTDLGMYDSVYCDRETFTAEKLVVLAPGRAASRWIAELPVAEQAREDLLMLYGDPPDWFPGLSDGQKKERLAGLTYAGFLKDVCKVHPDVLRFVQTMPNDEWGYGSDAFGAIDAWGSAGEYGYPGFQGLGLDRTAPSPYNSPSMIKGWGADDPYIYHFPEGNQAIVRMMIGRMIPGFTTAADMDDISTATFDYGRLDLPGNQVSIRLSSPVVSVANDGDPATATGATVGYFDGDVVRTVGAANVIMACWNMVIPYLVGELPAEQKEALRKAVKVPMLYATVQLRGWTAWQKMGVNRTRFTGAYWSVAELDYPVSIGDYRPPMTPDQPINVHMISAPAVPGMSPAAGSVAGRYALIKTPYDYLEYSIRDQLTRLLGPGGFDPGRDIQAITVNRWGHGYAPEYATPWNLDFYPGGPLPATLARRRAGRIAIANSDSVPAAYADAAITAAYRAVGELQA